MVTAIRVFLVLLVVSVSSSPVSAQRRYLSDLPAIKWMQSTEGERVVFVGGFLAGVQYVLNGLGMDVRSTGSGWTATTLSQEVYLKLLREPELRQGPIGPILMEAVAPYLTITDRSGKPIELDR